MPTHSGGRGGWGGWQGGHSFMPLLLLHQDPGALPSSAHSLPCSPTQLSLPPQAVPMMSWPCGLVLCQLGGSELATLSWLHWVVLDPCSLVDSACTSVYWSEVYSEFSCGIRTSGWSSSLGKSYGACWVLICGLVPTSFWIWRLGLIYKKQYQKKCVSVITGTMLYINPC